MIPMCRDAAPMSVYKRTVVESDGDVLETWEKASGRVFVSSYPISSARAQTDDGQSIEDLQKLMLNVPKGITVSTGDRLGDQIGPVWHLIEVKRSNGSSHYSCTARRL